MNARFHKYRDLQGILHEAFPSDSQSGTFDFLLQLPSMGWRRPTLRTDRSTLGRHIFRTTPCCGIFEEPEFRSVVSDVCGTDICAASDHILSSAVSYTANRRSSHKSIFIQDNLDQGNLCDGNGD